MKIIEVPVFNEDGSIKFTSVVSPEESQALLQFALNFLAGAGLAAQIKFREMNETKDEKPILND